MEAPRWGIILKTEKKDQTKSICRSYILSEHFFFFAIVTLHKAVLFKVLRKSRKPPRSASNCRTIAIYCQRLRASRELAGSKILLKSVRPSFRVNGKRLCRGPHLPPASAFSLAFVVKGKKKRVVELTG